VVTNLVAEQSFFRLGTTNDTDGDGMTDAYELLVSHTDPAAAQRAADTWQPLSQTVSVFDTVTFTVAANGTSPLSCQLAIRGNEP